MVDPARRESRLVARIAALLVLLLAAGAIWWPRPPDRVAGPVFVVLDPVADERRASLAWPALARVLAAESRTAPQVVVARSRAEFLELLEAGPDFLVCPDGVALAVPAQDYVPLAAGRRAAPRNLRPRGVLVSRRGAEDGEFPWVSNPRFVIFGDSLSLSATGVLRAASGGGAAPMPDGCSWGPDPYDHGPALHALRLGAYAHAVVRQWDLERFRAQGLLADADWTVREVTVPVPDLVLLAARRVPAGARVAVAERLAAIGRDLTERTPAEQDLAAALPTVGLAGFNLLVEPDFDLVRGNFAPDWPRHGP